MKVKGSLRRLCDHCKIVRRGKSLYVICSEVPRHKQRQGFHTLVGSVGEDYAKRDVVSNFEECDANCSCGCGRNGKVVITSRLPELR